MNYTEEQFEALAKYEDQFRTATRSNWATYVGFPAAKKIHGIMIEAGLAKANVHVNYACANCVLRLLKQAGKAWLEDKEARAKAAENPEQAAPAPAGDAPKKKAAPKSGKTKTAAKTAQK